jgi:serine/threonine-protein phosphatase 2A regulatory subunit B'
MQLFNSEDPRERDYLKTILHRVYGKFMSHRSFLRRSIANIFLQYVNCDKQHNGIGELLEILGSIVNGFALPLKKEHVDFLCNALLPLHKPRGIATFHPQLAYCVVQYSEKDTQCAIAVANYMVRVWPWSSSTKQLLLLNELEEILELVQGDHFEALKDTLFPCLAKCIGSPHFQIVERTLFMWHNEILLKSGCLKDMYAEQVLPMLFEPLYTAATKAHWNATVAGLCQKVLQMYQEMDTFLYDTCLERYNEDMANPPEEQKLSEWKALEDENGVDEKMIGLKSGTHMHMGMEASSDDEDGGLVGDQSRLEEVQVGIAA